MSWPGTGDPYYTLEGNSRRSLYGINSVPRLELDGGFDNGPTSLTQPMMDDAYALPAIVEIEAFYQVNEVTQTVDVQIRIKALQEIISAGGFFLYVAIFENQTTGNVKSNGETEFEHVMKKMIPNAGGTYIGAMTAGEIKNFNLSYTFNGDYILPPNATEPVNHTYNHTVEEFSDLGVAVWTQRSSTREVYQSAYAKSGTSSIQENDISGVNELSVYPNPSNEMARLIFSTTDGVNAADLTITDYAGKIVFKTTVKTNGTEQTMLNIDTELMAEGLYVITIQTETGIRSKKLSVVH